MRVVDASVAVKLVLAEEDSGIARSLWGQWQEQGERVSSPPLFRAETTSTLRKRVYRADIDLATGEAAFAALRLLPVRIIEVPGLYDRAWVLARELNRPTIYDCIYLALAEALGCEFWTADTRLWRVANPQFPWVRTLGDIQAGGQR